MKIPGYSKYEITQSGVVTEVATGARIELCKTTKTPMVRIKADDHTEKSNVTVHRLLALAFIGPCPEGCVATLKEGSRLHADNVEWISRRDLSVRCRDLAPRTPKTNSACTLKSTQTVFDALCAHDTPVTLVYLSSELSMPYSTVRYSMYGLIAAGKARATKGGYEVI